MEQLDDSFRRYQIREVTPQIVKQLNEGNVRAFDLIYHAYYIYLCAIAVYYVHDMNVAAELVNDVFLKLWNKKKDLKYPILPYMRRSIQNGSKSYLRSQLCQKGYQNVNNEEIWNYVEENILSSADPLQSLLNSELSSIISEKIEKLPLKCKRVVKACLYEGKTYEEVAEEQHIQISTVRVHLKKGLDNLRENLETPIWIVLTIFI